MIGDRMDIGFEAVPAVPQDHPDHVDTRHKVSRDIMSKIKHSRAEFARLQMVIVGHSRIEDVITDLKGRLNDGEDFAELAKEFSDDPTSANLGGDMGWFPPEAYGERVYQTLVAMSTGQTSEPFQTQGGWHIIELLGTRDVDRTEEAIRAEAREKIIMRKADQEIDKVLREFRDEAFVEIRLPGSANGSG